MKIRDGVGAVLNFTGSRRFLNGSTVPRGSTCVILPNFMAIDQTVAETCPFIYFSKWQLGFVCVVGPPTKSGLFSSLYRRAKFGWN